MGEAAASPRQLAAVEARIDFEGRIVAAGFAASIAPARGEATVCADEGYEREPLPPEWRERARAAARAALASSTSTSIEERRRIADRVQREYQIRFELEGLARALDAVESDLPQRRPDRVVCPSCKGRRSKQGGTCTLCAEDGTVRWSAAEVAIRLRVLDPSQYDGALDDVVGSIDEMLERAV